MNYRRWIAKVTVSLMVCVVGTFAAVVPASPAFAACSLETSVGKPYKLSPSSTDVYAKYTVEVTGCSGRYWTEYSYLNGPRSTGRTVTYQGNRSYTITHRVSSCRTGTYRAILHVIGESFDSFKQESRYIRC
jgi:hypothetical protein